MTRPRLLQIGPVTPPLDAYLTANYDMHPLWKEADRAGFLTAHGSEFAGAATHLRHKVGADVIDALPATAAIVSFGAGFENIDVAAARKRGVQVSNTPGVNSGCVADIAMGLMIDVARGMTMADRNVRAGKWSAPGVHPLMTRVAGKKLGLLGYGTIGRTIAHRSSGFDMQVRYNTRNPVAGSPHAHEPSLVELAKWADFLVVACLGGPQTRHLVNQGVMEALGPEGILVNIARGSVVDEAALVTALGSGKLGGAGLDVFEDEPKVPEALMKMDNVVLLSHIAGLTRETRTDMEQLFRDNLDAFIKTGKVITPV